MLKPMLVLVDMDGVQCDYGLGFDTKWQAAHPDAPYFPASQSTTFKLKDQYPAELHDKIDAIQQAPGFFRDLPPIPGAIEAMNEMLAAGHDVRICTAPLTRFENCVAEKFHWVQEQLGDEWVRRMILSKDKSLVLGDALVDDHPDITGVMTPEWTHVVFDQPYNRHLSGPRMKQDWSNWCEVLAEVAELRAERAA